MHLHEYQAKKLFARYGIPIPIGYVCSTPYEAEKAASKISNGPWAIKCQIHSSGRAKAGGVAVVHTKKDILTFLEKWRGKHLVTYQTAEIGRPVQKILIEAAIDIKQELYLGIAVDLSSRRVMCMAAAEGGIEIEKLAHDFPGAIHKVIIDPLVGPQPYQARELAFKLELIDKQVNQFVEIFIRLVRLFLELDLVIAEINPLVITQKGDLLCLDAKLATDNNALFRQSELRLMRDFSQEDALESRAALWNLNYVALNGNIGCVANGAGLAMAIIDMIKLYGGDPASFLDVSGAATKNSISEGFKIILSDNKSKGVLVNIFGGIVRCDLIADGIIDAISEVDTNIPVIVRLEGNNAECGIKKLKNSNLNILSSSHLTNAIQKVISAVKGR